MAIQDQEYVCCKANNCMFWVEESEPDGERSAREAQIPLVSADHYGNCGRVNREIEDAIERDKQAKTEHELRNVHPQDYPR